jgi:hypothetical protein
MTVPNHLLGVDLLKLILRAKDPFLPRFHCHSCKQKFNLPMNSTSPRPTHCTMCSSDFIEWVLPEDPHQRAARLRDSALLSRLRSRRRHSPPPSPSPSLSPSPPPPAPAPASKPEEPPVPEKKKEEEPMETESAAATESTKPTEEKSEATSGEDVKPPPEPMEQETEKKEPPPPPEEEPEEEPEEQRPTGGRLSAQPMVVVSAGGDSDHPTLTMNLFPSLDEAGPRNEGRRGPIRTTMVQQKTSRNFTYLAQEYMAKIIEGGRGRAGQTRRGQQLLVGLTGGAQTESSDPADFVWGARGLDSIISGLLESMSDRGPPPAKKDKVDAIPVVDATQETVNENVDGCTVCKDAFKVGDKLRRLPCKHLFHENCIIPWLKLHDTCPTCRYHVNTEKEKTTDDEEET